VTAVTGPQSFGDARPVCAQLLVPLTGTLVRLEPLTREHEANLCHAARDSDWSLMPLDAGNFTHPAAAQFDTLVTLADAPTRRTLS
jgi:hypothetical protein